MDRCNKWVNELCTQCIVTTWERMILVPQVNLNRFLERTKRIWILTKWSVNKSLPSCENTTFFISTFLWHFSVLSIKIQRAVPCEHGGVETYIQQVALDVLITFLQKLGII